MQANILPPLKIGTPIWWCWLIAASLVFLLCGIALTLGRPIALAASTSVLSLACLSNLYVGAKNQELLAPLTLYSALFLFHFGLPGFVHVFEPDPFVNKENWIFADEAMLFVLLNLIAVQIGCRVARWNGRVENAPTRRVWAPRRVAFVVGVLLVLGTAARAYVISANAYFQVARSVTGELAGPFYALVRMVELFPLQGLAIWALYHFRERSASVRSVGVLAALFVSEMVYWLPSGRKEPVVLAILMLLFARYLQRKEIPSFAWIATIGGFVAVLFPAVYYYRYAIEVGGWFERNPLDIVLRSADTALTTRLGDAGPFKVALDRISLLEPVSTSLRLIEREIWPSFSGSSYLDGLYVLIPRLLWPSKPDYHYGTEFGQIGGFIDSTDWVTSISVTFPGEAFLNFGWFGVCVMGLIAWAFTRLYLAANKGEVSKLLYLISLPVLLYIGGTFALYFGGLVKTLLVYLLLGLWMLPLSGGSRRSAT